MLYFAILIITLYFSRKYDFVDCECSTKDKEHAFYFIAIISTLLMALRFEIGDDTIVYANEYNYTQNFSFDILDRFTGSQRYQPGWIVLVTLCHTITDNFLLLQIVQCAIINIVFFLFIRKYTSSWFFASATYFVLSYLNMNAEILREAIAVAFGILAFQFNTNKKYLFAIGMLFLSFMFHKTGVIAIIVLLLSFVADNKRSRIIAGTLCLLSSFLWQLLPDLSMFIELVFSEGNIENYYLGAQETSVNIFGIVINSLKFIVLPFAIIYFIPVGKYKGLVACIFMYAFLKSLILYTPAFDRFSNYFVPFYWVGSAEAFYCMYKMKSVVFKNYIIAATIILSLQIYTVEYFYFGNDRYKDQRSERYERYFPYKSVLDPNNSYK